MYYRNAHAAVLVLDCTHPETLEKVTEWVEGSFLFLCVFVRLLDFFLFQKFTDTLKKIAYWCSQQTRAT
jgi:hypothetical protein